MESEPGFTVCACHSCAGRIEFNLDGFDFANPPEISCPHCNSKTQLYLPASAEVKKTRRVTLTKSQCAMPIVKRLLELLSTIEQDGVVTQDEARMLAAWLKENRDNCQGIQGTSFLLQTVQTVLSVQVFTNDQALQVQFAIERVLPKELRLEVAKKREAAALQGPASDRQKDYISHLGGRAQDGMTRAEASALIQSLSGASEKQLRFIRDLGGDPPPGLGKQEASVMIDELLANHSAPPSARQLMVLRFWGRSDLEHLSRNEVTEWMSAFYEEDHRRKAAWELYKLEQGDNGDPNSIPLGIGGAYLQKAASSQGSWRLPERNCCSCIRNFGRH